MNENIDLTKILEGCPKGTKFYSTIYGEVAFCKIAHSEYYPIELENYSKKLNLRKTFSVTVEGRKDYNFDGECTLYPSKDQRDWSKFERFWDKPKKEKFDVNTLQPFDKVLMRTNERSIWEPDFFGYKDGNWIMCVTVGNVECIPYNEETKHLLGTREDCPNYYKWWED